MTSSDIDKARGSIARAFNEGTDAQGPFLSLLTLDVTLQHKFRLLSFQTLVQSNSEVELILDVSLSLTKDTLFPYLY